MPHWLVRQDPLEFGVELYDMYADPEVTCLAQIERKALLSWLDRILNQQCEDPERMEPTVRELLVPACRIRLPSASSHAESLDLDCYAGTITIPLESRHGDAWVAGPRAGYTMHPPVYLRFSNDDGALILRAQIYWSPWRGEMNRVGSDLFEAVRRFEQRDWSEAFR